jgi:acetyl esterase/lipase
LAPDEVYPRQVHETIYGYKHVLDAVGDASHVCVAGDSAGASLILSLLQELGGRQRQQADGVDTQGGLAGLDLPCLSLPNLAVLISPWVTLVTNLHKPSRVDYLDRQTLWGYAHAYAGEEMLYQHPASPGSCSDGGLWKASSPRHGYFVTFGEEEVFAADIQTFVKRQADWGIGAEWLEFRGEVHAWPVASLFLSDTREKRLQGLTAIMTQIRKRFDNGLDDA